MQRENTQCDGEASETKRDYVYIYRKEELNEKDRREKLADTKKARWLHFFGNWRVNGTIWEGGRGRFVCLGFRLLGAPNRLEGI